jgi:hypothetical protein
MRAATKQAMKKRLLGKRRFNPAIKIRVDTEVTEVIEVDNLVDTTPGRLLLEPHSHGLGKVAATLRLKGGLCHKR